MSECTLKYRIAQQKLSNIHTSIIAFPNKYCISKQSHTVFPNMKPDPDNTIDAEKPGKSLVALGVTVKWQASCET